MWSRADEKRAETIRELRKRTESDFYDNPDETYWIPYCLSFLSRYPLYNLLGDYLRGMWIHWNKATNLFHAEEVSRILSFPAPRLNDLVRIDMKDYALCYQFPSSPTGFQNFAMWPLFSCLSIPNIVGVIEAAISPTRRIIFVSHYPAMLTMAAETVRYCVRVYEWSGLYVPMVHARHAKELVQEPGPYILGVTAECRSLFTAPTDALVVDLDRNFVLTSSPPTALNANQRNKFVTRLTQALNGDVTPSGAPAHLRSAYGGGKLVPAGQIIVMRGEVESIQDPEWWNQDAVMAVMDHVCEKMGRNTGIKAVFGGAVKKPLMTKVSMRHLNEIVRERNQYSRDALEAWQDFINLKGRMDTELAKVTKRNNYLNEELDSWKQQVGHQHHELVKDRPLTTLPYNSSPSSRPSPSSSPKKLRISRSRLRATRGKTAAWQRSSTSRRTTPLACRSVLPAPRSSATTLSRLSCFSKRLLRSSSVSASATRRSLQPYNTPTTPSPGSATMPAAWCCTCAALSVARVIIWSISSALLPSQRTTTISRTRWRLATRMILRVSFLNIWLLIGVLPAVMSPSQLHTIFSCIAQILIVFLLSRDIDMESKHHNSKRFSSSSFSDVADRHLKDKTDAIAHIIRNIAEQCQAAVEGLALAHDAEIEDGSDSGHHSGHHSSSYRRGSGLSVAGSDAGTHSEVGDDISVRLRPSSGRTSSIPPTPDLIPNRSSTALSMASTTMTTPERSSQQYMIGHDIPTKIVEDDEDLDNGPSASESETVNMPAHTTSRVLGKHTESLLHRPSGARISALGGTR